MHRDNRLPVAVLLTCAIVSVAGDFYTYPVLEPDRLGCMWMIARHVDTTAVFTLVPKDSVAPGKDPLDIPASTYRRYPRMSATMSVAHFNKIKDAHALRIGTLMNHIELGFWGAGKSDDAAKLEQALWEIVRTESDTAEAITKAFAVLDSVAGFEGP
jgi:hypothetical protein